MTIRLSPRRRRRCRAISTKRDGRRFGIGGHAVDSTAAVDDAMDQIPMKDIGRFVGAARRRASSTRRSGRAWRDHRRDPAEAGLFVLEDGHSPLATAICVHDGDLAGLFEVATEPGERGKGMAARVVLSALKWARLRGATRAWLQVEADNTAGHAALRVDRLREVYRYHYRRRRTAEDDRTASRSCSSRPARWSTRTAAC